MRARYGDAVPSATVLTDPDWLRDDLATARRMYGKASSRVLGTIRWYSISTELLGPTLDSLVRTGVAMDPSLDAVTIDVLADGRVTGARASRPLSGQVAEVGAALSSALSAAIGTIAEVSGAARPALWAIAGDSISNRLLWAGMAAGDTESGTRLAEPLADAVGPPLPRPRYLRVGASTVVRRASCCLIYEATGGPKCVSCPRQHPDERTRRLHEQLG